MTAKNFSSRRAALGAVICGILCLALLCGLALVTQTGAYAAETIASGDCGESVSWTLDDAGVLTVSGSGAMTNYSQGGAPWYSQRESITSVVIESGVTSIGNCAFIDHGSLASVKVPKSVSSIGAYALCNCTSLTGISLQRGIETIGNYAFHNSGLTVMVLPEGTVSIGYAAFHNCTALTSVTVPESVTSIGNYAFWNCTALKKVKFNAVAMNDLGAKNYVFANAGNDTAGIKVTIGANVTKLPIYLFCPDNGSLSYYPKVTSVEFEDGSVCTSICAGAFENCCSLESLVIPESVTGIGDYAFNNCTSLTAISFNAIAMNDFSTNQYVFGNAGKDGDGIKVTIGAEVTKIPACLFYPRTVAPNITNVVFEEGSVCTSIGNYAFCNCSALESITLPNSIASIGVYAFCNCPSLKSVAIPKSTTVIQNYTFHGCTSLESVTMHGGITSIGYAAFYNCTSLKSITIPESVTSFGGFAFWNCRSLKKIKFNAVALNDFSSTNYVFAYAGQDTAGTKVIIGSEVTKLPIYLFCPKNNDFTYSTKITSVEFEEGSKCTEIRQSAFECCNSLESITIPDSVTSIGNYAFFNCVALKSVTIGSGVTGIGSYAFHVCTALEEINFNATALNDFGSNNYVFGCAGQNGDGIKVTFGANVTKIPAYLFCPYNSSVSWTYAPKITSVVFEEGSVCTEIRQYAFDLSSSLETITLPESITTIGNCAFADGIALKSITLPESLVSIGSNAFLRCTSLEGIVLPEGTETIGSYAFYCCTSLGGSVIIPDSVTSIGEYAFCNCQAIKSLTIGAGLKTVGKEAFKDCTAIEEIHFNAVAMNDLSENYAFYNIGTYGSGIKLTVGTEVTRIPNFLFYSVYSIKSVSFEKGSKCASIGNYAFCWCEQIKDISIPDSVTSIGTYAFYRSGLTSLKIGKNVASIGANAFSWCMGLKSLTIPESVTSIGTEAFYWCTSLEELSFNAVAMNDLSNNAYVFHYIGKDSGGVSVKIGANVTKIPAYLLQYGTYITSVEFAQGSECVSIGAYAFSGCNRITEMKLPEGITSIGSAAFNECYALESINIPESTTSLGTYAFCDCTSLERIDFDAAAMKDLSFGNQTFSRAGQDGDGIKVVFGANVTKVPAYLFYPTKNNYTYAPKIVSVEFEEGSVCTSIGAGGVFCYITGIKSIVLPETLESIGSYAFYNTGLESIVIPDSVTSLGSDAFRDCADLKTVTIGKGVKSMGSGAFENCPLLTEIRFNAVAMNDLSSGVDYFFHTGHDAGGITFTVGAEVTRIPASLFYYSEDSHSEANITSVVFEEGSVCTVIGAHAFRCLTNLVSIVIPDSVTSVGSYAFAYDTALESVTIGKGVKSIGEDTFYRCVSITEINFNAVAMNDLSTSASVFSFAGISGDGIKLTIGNEVTKIPASLFFRDGENIYKYPAKIVSVVFEEGSVCTTIGNSAFRCITTLESIKLPQSVKTIGEYSFRGCTGLVEVILEEGLEVIGYNSFWECSALGSVNIPESVTTIGAGAFQACFALESVTIPKNVVSIGNVAFGELPRLREIRFNAIALKDQSETNSIFSRCGRSGDGITVIIGAEVTRIPAYMFCPRNDTSYYPYSAKITSVVFEEGSVCTSIGNAAFEGCSELTAIELPESLESIGNWAFYYTGLESIVIPDSVTSIGKEAFYRCSALTSVTIGKGVKSIGNHAFYECMALRKIKFNAVAMNDLSGSNWVFRYAGRSGDGIKVIIGKDVTRIPAVLFYPCGDDTTYYRYSPKITSVEFEKGSVCTSIGNFAFEGLTELKSIVIPDTVTSIGGSAFYWCRGLESVTIGEGVTYIGSDAFNSCTSLKTVMIKSEAIAAAMTSATACQYLCNYADVVLVRNGIENVGSYITSTFAVADGMVKSGGVIWTVYSDHSHALGSECWTANEDGSNTCSVCGIVEDRIYAQGSCGENAAWVLTNDGTLTISGTGAMYDYSKNTIPWRAYSSRIIKVVIEEGITSIGSSAFNSESVQFIFTEISLPSTLTSIGQYAFYCCASLEEITIPASVTAISSFAFRKCTALRSVIFERPEAWLAGETVISTGELADSASAANALKAVYYGSDMCAVVNEFDGLYWRLDSDGVLTIYGNGAMGDYNKTTMPWFSVASSIKKVVICEGVTSIGKSAFNSEKVYFGITEVSFPSTLTSIGQYAFFGCKELTSIVLPESLESIGAFAFRKTGLVSVTFSGDACWSIGTVAKLRFESTSGAACALAVQYYNKGWTRCELSDEVTVLTENGRCGSKVFWRLTEDGTLTISGKGEMYAFGTYTGISGWRNCSDKVKRVVIESGVTSIGAAAFYECKSIEEVVLADSVKKIGDWAFCRCTSLVDINVDNVTSIGDHTFRKCGSLRDQTLVERYGKAT